MFYGQAVPTQNDVQGLADYLAGGTLNAEKLKLLAAGPLNRGAIFPMPPTDPVIYRLYEVSAGSSSIHLPANGDCRAYWFTDILSK